MKQTERTITPVVCIVLLFFLSSGYVLNSLWLSYGLSKETRHLYLLMGGLSFVLFFIGLNLYGHRSKWDHQFGNGLFRHIATTMKFLEIPTLIGLILCSMILISPRGIMGDKTLIFKIDIFCIILMYVVWKIISYGGSNLLDDWRRGINEAN